MGDEEYFGRVVPTEQFGVWVPSAASPSVKALMVVEAALEPLSKDEALRVARWVLASHEEDAS